MSKKTHVPDSHWWKPLPWFFLLRKPLWTIQATTGATVEWQLEWQWSNSRSAGRGRWSNRLSYNCYMLEYKVIKFPPWLFSMMSNTAMRRKTHTPDSHWWKPLPCFCLLKWRPGTIQATAGATGEWQLEWQWSNRRSADRVRLSHRLSCNCSMLEYKVIKFPPWLFSTMLNTAMSRKTHAPYSHWWKLLPWFCRLSRGPWTIQATAKATVEWHLDWQWSNSRTVGTVRWSQRLRYYHSTLEYKVIKFLPWLLSTMLNTAMVRKTHAPDSHWWKPYPVSSS